MMKTFNEFYAENYKLVLAHITFKTYDKAIAEDIVADAFIKMYKNFDSFNKEKANYLWWAKSIADNNFRDYWRKQKIGFKTTTDSDFVNSEGECTLQIISTDDSDSHIENAELSSAIAKAFRSLKPNVRKVAIQRFMYEKDYKDIARDCALPINSVKVMIMRAKAVLQTALA